MPRKRNGEIPLPDGWDYGHDYDGKIYFIDHNTKKTTWIDPRDRFTKPHSFADCIGNELPFGWEEAYDGQIGPYYINHGNHSTQLEDPRQEWRAIQEKMLREYLQFAQDVYEAKKDIYQVKSQRLTLAQDEYNHLNNALTTLATSRTSLCSSTSSVSTKYDPDLLKSDVASAKDRVSRLKSELEQIRNEMSYTQKGVNTLTSVEQKLSSQQGTCYNIGEAQAIMAELKNIQKSLSSGEKERAELMQSLAKLKDDLTRLQLAEGSPDVSTLSLPLEKSSTASQTDLSCDLVPIGTRLAEMAKIRLKYDEARKRVQHIQQKLADLEEKVQPGQVESDKDRLLLFQEKEQLLRELRSITPRMRSKKEMTNIQMECEKLEQDLKQALEMSNRAIADRLRLHEEKQLLLQQLRDALHQMTHLESQLKTLSASTLSVSSSSSLGSLSTTSSKGSLSSGLSFTDIYGGPQYTVLPNPDKPIDMADLQKRVQRLLKGGDSTTHTPSPGRSQPSLSPRSSLSSVSPPVSPMYENLPCIVPPPTYEQVERDRRLSFEKRQIDERLNELRLGNGGPNYSDYVQMMQERILVPNVAPLGDMLEASCNQSQGSGLGRPVRYSYESTGDPQLSPISETPPPLLDNDEMLLQATTLSRTSSSGTNTRSVSAAVSDESVAGDSGVFEASNRRKLGGIFSNESDLETAQVYIRLRYDMQENALNVCVEKARNLMALAVQEPVQIYVKIALLPPVAPPYPSVYSTKTVRDLRKVTFDDNFVIPVPANKICTKTLQLNVWCKREHQDDRCLGCAQVSLADFSLQTTTQKWYNILSLQLRDCSDDVKTHRQETIGIKEESSDDSTIISSQTSTLTRNQESASFTTPTTFDLEFSHLVNCLKNTEGYDEDSEEDDEDDDEEDDDDDEEDIEITMLNEKLEIVIEQQDQEECERYTDKQTNTECAFYPEQAKQMKLAAAAANGVPIDDRGAIKRSQTFSPSAHATKNHQYICKLNRSDSDSAMAMYRRHNKSFERNAIERRSLRYRRQSTATTTGTKTKRLTPTARTSIDLELDLQAQHTRLEMLNIELVRLRELKTKLELAKEKGDTETVSYLLGDQQFQNLIALAENCKSVKSAEEKKVEKMLKKVSREIYKLRKTKAGNGKPDLISFREKMAFFTRVNSVVPVLPSDECHSVNERKTEEIQDEKVESTISKSDEVRENAEGGVDKQTSEEVTERYEYVIDKVLGVEV